MKYVTIKNKDPVIVVFYDKKTKKKMGTMDTDKFRKFMENGYAPRNQFLPKLVELFNKEPGTNYAVVELNSAKDSGLENFGKRLAREAKQRKKWHDKKAGEKDPEQAKWVKVKNVEVLRIGDSKYVAVPNSGKKNSARFDIIDIDKGELIVQLKKKEVQEWLYKANKK